MSPCSYPYTSPLPPPQIHEYCKLSTFMLSFMHSLHVSLFLPLHLTPATSTSLQSDMFKTQNVSYSEIFQDLKKLFILQY